MPSNMNPNTLIIRPAKRTDVPSIVKMLANDPLGAKREQFQDPLPRAYYQAFDVIERDPNNEIFVALYDDSIVGVLQMTFIPYLTYKGRWRALVEGFRVSPNVRGKGVGTQLMNLAISKSEERGCHMVQLTTDKQRKDARRFYESLGFVATHEGMKLHLPFVRREQ